MIIVNPDYIAGLNKRLNILAEGFINLFVGPPEQVIKNSVRWEIMEKRLDCFVANTVVKIIHKI